MTWFTTRRQRAEARAIDDARIAAVLLALIDEPEPAYAWDTSRRAGVNSVITTLMFMRWLDSGWIDSDQNESGRTGIRVTGLGRAELLAIVRDAAR